MFVSETEVYFGLKSITLMHSTLAQSIFGFWLLVVLVHARSLVFKLCWGETVWAYTFAQHNSRMKSSKWLILYVWKAQTWTAWLIQALHHSVDVMQITDEKIGGKKKGEVCNVDCSRFCWPSMTSLYLIILTVQSKYKVYNFH